MADRSLLDEKIAVLSAKVDELVAYKNAPPADASQAEIDATVARLDEILARIP
jgi:uroporphyrinogen-III synthase